MRIPSFALLDRRLRISNLPCWLTGTVLAGLSACSHDAREPEMQPASGTVESVRVVDGNTSVTIDRSDVPSSGTEPVSHAASQALRDGILTITDGRCEAEMKCGNIGVSRKFETLAACQTQVGEEVRGRFDTPECRANFATHVLERCLSALREDECNAPIDGLSRIESCRTTTICTD